MGAGEGGLHISKIINSFNEKHLCLYKAFQHPRWYVKVTMNLINILHAVDKGFLQWIFTAMISLTLPSFAVSFTIHDWFTVFRVLFLLMLKMHMLLLILQGDPGEIYDNTFHAFISIHEQGQCKAPCIQNTDFTDHKKATTTICELHMHE